MTTNERAKARAARLAAVLDADGTVTPAQPANPQLSSICEQANALDYDVTIVFTPRQKGKREVRVSV